MTMRNCKHILPSSVIKNRVVGRHESSIISSMKVIILADIDDRGGRAVAVGGRGMTSRSTVRCPVCARASQPVQLPRSLSTEPSLRTLLLAFYKFALAAIGFK